jgi:hypothetical protein
MKEDIVKLTEELDNLNKILLKLKKEIIANAKADFIGIGKWLSAALDDHKVCEEMKEDIRDWMKRYDPIWEQIIEEIQKGE